MTRRHHQLSLCEHEQPVKVLLSLSLLLHVTLALDSCRGDDFDRSYGRIKSISQTVSDQIPIVVAEGGASGYLCSNTRESVVMAHTLGADYIQLTVGLSSDGIPVAVPDTLIENCTNASQLFPERITNRQVYCSDYLLSELKQLSIRSQAAAPTSDSELQKGAHFGITSLEEHIRLIQTLNNARSQNTGLYLDLILPRSDNSSKPDLSARVIDILKQHGYSDAEDRIFVTSDSAKEILRLRTDLDCQLPLLQRLQGTPTSEEIAEISRVADGIVLPITELIEVSPSGIKAVSDTAVVAHGHALMVHVSGVQTKQLSAETGTAAELFTTLSKDAGVDGMLCRRPDTALTWRAASHQSGPRRGPFHLLHGRPKMKADGN